MTMMDTNGPLVDDDAGKAAAVLTSFADATRPSEPAIREPEDGGVRLMWGYVEPNGTRHTYAQVRELCGADEEALSRVKKGGDLYFAQIEDLILRRAVEAIGSVQLQGHPEATGILGGLLMGDRGVLLAAVLRATYGSKKEYENLPCPHCNEQSDIEIDVDGITDKREMQTELPEVTVPLRKGGTVTLRYPTGEDQMAVLSAKEGATEEEMNTQMIARCITSTSQGPVFNPHEYALRLGALDRKKIVLAMVRNAPALTFKEVSVPCPHCSEKIPFVFGWADLLFN